ncbi:cytochrome c oxidase subunit II [Chelativorans sp. ZYF759]|uniref:cytochrome c oxidase subunit II n=1 Tax=Chelativorans sp. ZYF759 TaxID=2692213 RepID=UPI00145D5E88|nr:cytochrome c oxidase subunit II [Chelativorans sp. ZYF759]NMG40453.1 cytochrome c oxidase subunit II [Chelativorans sp. ZYF759]
MSRSAIKRICVLGVTGLLTAGCTGPLSTLEPAGPAAASIALLWWIMLAGSVVLFAIVIGLFTLAFYRPAWLAGISARNWILHGGITMSSVVILLLLVAAFVLGERLVARPLADPPLAVQANGRMWVWEFSYPSVEGPSLTTNVLHIPAGEIVDVRVTSSDVIHSFWSPRLAGKIDAVPGHENVVRLTAERPGTYRGVCAEFCGVGHTQMHFTVIAHPPEAYEQALADAIAAETTE